MRLVGGHTEQALAGFRNTLSAPGDKDEAIQGALTMLLLTQQLFSHTRISDTGECILNAGLSVDLSCIDRVALQLTAHP